MKKGCGSSGCLRAFPWLHAPCRTLHMSANPRRRYGSHWKASEAEKNLLRTHTTAVSSRMLYRLAQVPPLAPCRAADGTALMLTQLLTVVLIWHRCWRVGIAG